jgi:hypothetical protein
MDDDANDGEETTSLRTPFGREVDMRESHLDALPGKPYSELLDSLNRASQVFGGNSLELERHLGQFVGGPTHVNDLPEGFDVEGGGPVMQENSVLLTRAEFLKWSGWKAASRRHIESHDGDIEFLSAIADYSTKVGEFYEWFWEQVVDKVRVELHEYHGKRNEYNLWRHVESTFSHFGPDGRHVYKPRLAAARLERAAYGTNGWRVFTSDEHGEWVVGESDWPPLPVGPR